MGERISSDWTVWHKLLPGLMSIVFALVGIVVLVRAPGSQFAWFLFAGVGFLFLHWRSQRLRTVSLLDYCLVVDDGKTRCHVPVGSILSVAQTRWPRPLLVTVALREPQPAGSSFVFVPRGLALTGPDDAPITQRLRRLAENAAPGGCPHEA